MFLELLIGGGGNWNIEGGGGSAEGVGVDILDSVCVVAEVVQEGTESV